jgi:pimeloyl-ACP methyl ester carboxylesterase
VSAGRSLALDEFGSGEPLVLIHGVATTRHVWDTVVPLLAPARRVVTLDVPGFGQSEPVDSGFELGNVADRIADGLELFGVGVPFDLVGHSLGAGIALLLAARFPGSVRRLVLVAPAGFARVPRLASAALAASADALLAARRSLAPLTDLRWGRRLLLGFAAADGARVPATQARLIVNSSAHAQRTAKALATITAADLGPVLRDVSAPLGLIWGTDDRTVPARLALAVRDARPDGELELVQRAGHLVMIERPEAFVEALQRLLSRLPKDATTLAAEDSTLA